MTIPKRYYRYGVAAEKALYDQVIRNVDGFVLPAHLVVDQQQSLGPWLADKGFYVDPMTHVWFSSTCDLENSTGGGFKRSYGKLMEVYGSPYSTIKDPTQKISLDVGLNEKNIAHRDFMESLARIVDFQIDFVGGMIRDAEIQAYEEVIREMEQKEVRVPTCASQTLPQRIVLPYIYFRGYDSDEYRLNKVIWEHVKECETKNVPLFAMIATDEPLSDWSRISEDLKGNVDGVVLWFSSIDEINSSVDQLTALRSACKTLSSDGFKVSIHSGGAFAMGLGFDGVEDVSGGITYGEQRAPDLVKGGPVPQRYFVPQLLRVMPQLETKFAIKRLGFDCDNLCCSPHKHDIDQFIKEFFPAKPGKPNTNWGPVRNTKLHYLYRFSQKINEVWKDGKDAGIGRLETMRTKAEASLPEDYWIHFDTWIQAYEKKI